MTFDYLQFAEEIVGVVALSFLGFYATRLLLYFKSAMLAKSWKYVAFGAVFLVLAQFSLVASGITNSESAFLLGNIATLLRFVGAIFLIFGLRAHFQFWRLDNKQKPSPMTASHEPLES